MTENDVESVSQYDYRNHGLGQFLDLLLHSHQNLECYVYMYVHP